MMKKYTIIIYKQKVLGRVDIMKQENLYFATQRDAEDYGEYIKRGFDYRPLLEVIQH